MGDWFAGADKPIRFDPKNGTSLIIDAISDLHGFCPDLQGGDLLVIAGDLTAHDGDCEHRNFVLWLMTMVSRKKLYRKIIYIAGNHDNFLYSKNRHGALKTPGLNIEYLCDSGTKFGGFNIWGTPWTPTFEGVNSKCKAFMADDEFWLDKKFSLIPDDTDIVISHGPMRHILDADSAGYACGSDSLRRHIDRVKPKFHIFGHIHEQGGNELMYKHIGPNTWCVNCSYVDKEYKPAHKPVRIIASKSTK